MTQGHRAERLALRTRKPNISRSSKPVEKARIIFFHFLDDLPKSIRLRIQDATDALYCAGHFLDCVFWIRLRSHRVINGLLIVPPSWRKFLSPVRRQ